MWYNNKDAKGKRLSVNMPQTPSVIDTLSEGYRSVHRRPLLLLLPILLNLYLWFGVQISFGPLLNTLVDLMQSQQRMAGENTAAEQIEQLRQAAGWDMQPTLAALNFIPRLTLNQVDASQSAGALGMPMVRPVLPVLSAGRPTLVIGSVGGALLTLLLVNLVALGLSAPFLTRLAEAVRGDQTSLAQWLRRAWRALLAITGYAAIVVGVVLAVGLPFFLLVSVMVVLSPALALMALFVLFMVWFWGNIYIGFTPEAIAVSGIGPLKALRASFEIVRQNILATLGFLALSYIIGVGSGVIWLMLQNTFASAGLIIGSVGSAYIGSGLLAARMAFYRERLRRWQATVGARG